MLNFALKAILTMGNGKMFISDAFRDSRAKKLSHSTIYGIEIVLFNTIYGVNFALWFSQG